ncbi:hypothetical protein DIKCMJMK_01923 [Shewanella oneidensis]|nr:hypothetical protein [Shewanella oneidensis]
MLLFYNSFKLIWLKYLLEPQSQILPFARPIQIDINHVFDYLWF